jgi:kynurenine formamidase
MQGRELGLAKHTELEEGAMTSRSTVLTMVTFILGGQAGCGPPDPGTPPLFEPREVIDLGAVVTEDLPERVWGREVLDGYVPLGLDRQNTFHVIEWDFTNSEGPLRGSNSYFELFNHGGPHVDAPRHISVGPGIDSYPVEAFSGPLKVFDVRDYPPGRSVPLSVFEGNVDPGDVVIIFTGRELPTPENPRPAKKAVTVDAALYLANLPVRAFGTDCYNVEAPDPEVGNGENATDQRVPNHFAFLSRGIPIYEQLFNLERLVERPDSDRMYFVGAPLNIKDGDAMLVRPVVFVY